MAPTTYTPSATTTAAYNALKTAPAPNATGAITQADNQYGVPAAQKSVTDLQNNVNNLSSSINAVDPSVTGRTSGTFTTEAQREALVNAEQQPLQTDLGNANTALSTGETALNNDNSNATSLATALMSGDQAKYQQLLDAYNASAAQDQATTQSNQFAQQLAESRYEAELAAENKAVATPTIGGLTGGTTNTPPSTTTGTTGNSNTIGSMTKRSTGGFNFAGANGEAISAGTYAAANKIPIGTLLQQMGQSGDLYAQQAYNEIQSNLGFYNSHPDMLKSEFAPLFWGMQ